MAYYVTGYYKESKESGYYVFDTKTTKTVKLSNKFIRSNEIIVKDIINVRLSGYSNINKPALRANKTRNGYKLEHKPTIVDDSKVVERNGTIAYLDFNKSLYGVADCDLSEVKWYSLDNLNKEANKYNNLMYRREDGLLDLEHYHIIGEDKKFNIYLTSMVDKGEDNIDNSNEDTTIKQDSNIDENSIDVIKWLSENTKEYTEDRISMTQKDFYVNMLLMLRDNDTITLPTWVIKKLGFKLKVNLEKSMNLDKRVSLGTIELGEGELKQYMILIVKFDDSLDYAKVQVAMSTHLESGKDYSIEGIRSNFSKWLNHNKFLSIK